MIILIWLFAIVAANLSIGHFGPSSSIINAFLLIGLSLTTRDYLHKKWEGKNITLRMGSLIAAGGLISWLTQPSVGKIALASVIAFAISEAVDAIIFHKTKSVNKSNSVSAFIDSILFPTIAFGGFPILIILGQWFAKTAGGAAWHWVLSHKKLWATIGLIAIGSSAQGQIVSFEYHQNDNDETYTTTSIFVPGETEIFAFYDSYDNDINLKYGEVAIYSNKWTLNPTIQLEAGTTDFFEIDEVVLAGVRWNGFEVLVRSDDAMQLTYVWFVRRGQLQFNGYIDMWNTDNVVQSIAQPQLWFWVNNHLAIGGEVFCTWSEDVEFNATPSLAVKVSYSF
jgi:hypothetical protein